MNRPAASFPSVQRKEKGNVSRQLGRGRKAGSRFLVAFFVRIDCLSFAGPLECTYELDGLYTASRTARRRCTPLVRSLPTRIAPGQRGLLCYPHRGLRRSYSSFLFGGRFSPGHSPGDSDSPGRTPVILGSGIDGASLPPGYPLSLYQLLPGVDRTTGRINPSIERPVG